MPHKNGNYRGELKKYNKKGILVKGKVHENSKHDQNVAVSQVEKEEVLKEVNYTKEPEEFKQAIYSIQKFFYANDFFHGTFRRGTIDGVYFSNGLIDLRRIFSIVKIKGSYNLEDGTISFKISKSTYYYIMFALLFVFGVAGTTMTLQNDQVPKIFALFPWFIVLLNYIIYYFGYRSREKEIIQYFEHFLGLEKDLLD